MVKTQQYDYIFKRLSKHDSLSLTLQGNINRPYHARPDIYAGGWGRGVGSPDQGTPLSMDRTDSSENITFPRTTHVVGDKS